MNFVFAALCITVYDLYKVRLTFLSPGPFHKLLKTFAEQVDKAPQLNFKTKDLIFWYLFCIKKHILDTR